MKRRVILLLPLALWAEEDGLQHSLTKYVTDDGKVRYGALKADLGPLEKYVEKLKSLEEGRMGLADWINAYNALILWSFAKEYPQEKDRLKNPLRRASYFYRRKFVVAGRERSLADIENNSIRKAFREPRIHFAIVCASASCPYLSRRVYRAADLKERLEQDAVRFIEADRNVLVNAAEKTVTVSEIFKWFREDFGGSEKAVLEFLSRYKKTARLNEPGWRVRYSSYDWSINDLP
ncbi:MAG: DUF547 domain-containing protein [Acidobacteria bacterium]|nr:DUF547 domain-containing protein [Acidobacteriota bacterium]